MDIVVSRYKESLFWLPEILCDEDTHVRVFVYNKSGQDVCVPLETHQAYIEDLPNVGREAHTFLYHIVTHYEDIAPETMFLQGNPLDHERKYHRYRQCIKGKVKYEENDTCYAIRGSYDFVCNKHGTPCHENLNLDILFKDIFQKEKEIPLRFKFSPGAQYVVQRKGIHSHPKSFWENILHMSTMDPQFPWRMERLWRYVFSDVMPDF